MNKIQETIFYIQERLARNDIKMEKLEKELQEIKQDLKDIKNRILGFFVSGLFLLLSGLLSFILNFFIKLL